MSAQQQLLYSKLVELLTNYPVQSVPDMLEVLTRLMITILSVPLSIDKVTKDSITQLKRAYYVEPTYENTVMLQLLNILELTETIGGT